MSDNFIFFPSTDSAHEVATIINMTRVYEGLHSLNFRYDSVCLVHRHCIISLQVSYEGAHIYIAGKERILKFIDGMIVESEVEQGDALRELRDVVLKAEPKKFSFEEFELQQRFEEEQNQERKM